MSDSYIKASWKMIGGFFVCPAAARAKQFYCILYRFLLLYIRIFIFDGD
jgi:hypothetical protein